MYCIILFRCPYIISSERLYAEQYGVYRLDFTLEDEKETARILEYYEQIYSGEKNMEFPCADYTNGHYKRGVE